MEEVPEDLDAAAACPSTVDKLGPGQGQARSTKSRRNGSASVACTWIDGEFSSKRKRYQGEDEG